jgi:CubicO group peptidase (beta-lactamase class C family)
MLQLRLLSLLLIGLFVNINVFAQDNTTEVDKLFGWTTAATPGCVCAVSQHGKLVMNRAYGSADLEREVPLRTNSVFDIASIQKQFVAAAILLLVEDGRLALSDDVRKYIPELPDYGHTITVDHLLTHTSGLRDWTGIFPLANGSPDALSLILRQRGLNFTPGEEWSYSNSGYVLLKEMITRISGKPIDQFLRTRLFDPLGMKSTQYLSDLRQVVKNRALAYEKNGDTWRLEMKLDNDRGGGGAMMSTAEDLLIWNEALANSQLGKFVTEKLQEPASLKNGRKIAYARALFLDENRGGKVIWHTGGSAGYGSILVRFPGQGLSVAILCNSGDTGNRTAWTRRIFDLFVPGADTVKAQAPVPDAFATNGISADLNSKAGTFFSASTGQPLRLAVNNGSLRIAGGPALVTVGNNRFKNPNSMLSFMSGDQFELHFLSNNAFELKSMEGKSTVFNRAKPAASADLQTFAGRYHSDEIGGFLDISVEKNALMGRANDVPGPGFALKPADTDAFQLGGVILRFHRDKNGKVVSLDYSNPLIRNLKFTRLPGK